MSQLQQLPGSPGCVICDNNASNHRSLALTILWDPDEQAVHIPCTPDESWCGYSSIVHGGLVASVLDEAMAWVVKQVSGDWAFTVDYHIRYKAAVEPGNAYEAVAVVSEPGRRKILARARFLDGQGNVAAEADAVFLPVKGRAKPRESRPEAVRQG